MAPPQSLPKLLLLAALAGFLGPSEVVAETVEEAGAHCPEGLWPLPPQVLPRVTYTQVRPGQVSTSKGRPILDLCTWGQLRLLQISPLFLLMSSISYHFLQKEARFPVPHPRTEGRQ
ncbi:Hypothetical predicted protein [Marmota monax]|uniref:Uncharacterized protein n=1 Tax=Marmota monax TaxID=9995 RepID=A0A5E4AB07_MARMO|nr:hypothetical protein GHT09_017424 [Marmota monax]VTJ54487.1 Hypothetical predicted protein [Marmota monax]